MENHKKLIEGTDGRLRALLTRSTIGAAAEVMLATFSFPRFGKAFHTAVMTGLSMGVQAVMIPKRASRVAVRAILEYASFVLGSAGEATVEVT